MFVSAKMGDRTTEEKELVPSMFVLSNKRVGWCMWSCKFLAKSTMRIYFEVCQLGPQRHF